MLISSKGRDTTSLRGGGKQISCTAKKPGWKKIAQGEPGKSNSSKVILLTGPHKLLPTQNIKHKANERKQCHATENCTALPPSKWSFPKDNLNLTHVSPIMLWQISPVLIMLCFSRWARAPSKLPGSLCATFLGREFGKLGSNNISMRCRDRPVSTKPNDDVVRLIVDLAPIL